MSTTGKVEPETEEEHADYIRRALAAMLWTPGRDGDHFDKDVADRVAADRIADLSINLEPGRRADVSAFATVPADEFDGLSNSHSTGLFDFTVAQFHDTSISEDGVVTVGFDGFHAAEPDLDVDDGLVTADATKYAVVVHID